MEKFYKSLKDVQTTRWFVDINNPLALKSVLIETMREFFLKYIQPDNAPLEINIPSRKRRNMVNIFVKDDVELRSTHHVIQQIMELFDYSAKETGNLIHDAAIRYRTQRRETIATIHIANSRTGTGQKAGLALLDIDSAMSRTSTLDSPSSTKRQDSDIAGAVTPKQWMEVVEKSEAEQRMYD